MPGHSQKQRDVTSSALVQTLAIAWVVAVSVGTSMLTSFRLDLSMLNADGLVAYRCRHLETCSSDGDRTYQQRCDQISADSMMKMTIVSKNFDSQLQVVWPGGQDGQYADADHAALQTAIEHRLSARRGDCPTGMREYDPNEGYTHSPSSPSCLVQRSHPNAIVAAATQLAAATASRRACGAWMDDYATRPYAKRGDGYSFLDIPFKTESMWALTQLRLGSVDAIGTLSLSPRRASRLLQECRTLVSQNDLLTDALVAYQLLLRDIGNISTSAHAMRMAGELAARGCEGFLDAAVSSLGGGFSGSITLYEGAQPEGSVVEGSVLILSGDLSTASKSRAALEYIGAQRSSCAREISKPTLDAILSGLSGLPVGAVASGYVSPSETHHLTWIKAFDCAIRAQHQSENSALSASSVEVAHAALRGVAAVCVADLSSRIAGQNLSPTRRSLRSPLAAHEVGVRSSSAPSFEGHRRPQRWPISPTRLGAGYSTKPPLVVDHDEPTRDEWLHATRVVGARRHVLQILDAPPWDSIAGSSSAGASCFATLMYASPALAEQELRATLVPPSLDVRLETLVARLREAVATAVLAPPFANVLRDPAEIARLIRDAKFRIAGAPSSNWAGPRDPQRHETQTTPAFEGTTMEFLDLYAAATYDAMQLALDQHRILEPCDMAPLFDSAEPNAYYLPAHNCVMIQLGLMSAPIADGAFDDASLLGRLGFVVAHEFAHAIVHGSRHTARLEHLLSAYTLPTTHEEALADVLALAALRTLPEFPTLDSALLHVGQLFCAVPYTQFEREVLFPAMQLSHPPGNMRIDALYETASTHLM